MVTFPRPCEAGRLGRVRRTASTGMAAVGTGTRTGVTPVSQTRATLAVVLAVLSLVISQPAAAVAAPSHPTRVPTSLADDAEPPIPTTETGAVATDRVVVRWQDAARAPGLEQARGLRRVADLGLPGAALVATDGRPVDEMLAGLRADPDVAYAEPDYVVQLTEEPEVATAIGTNDPLLGDQYSLTRMRVRDAWSVETGGSGVVAVLDTGVQATHPDLTGRLVAGYDFVNSDTNAADDNGHGTWVSGIIAARANDNYGIAGISWSDKIMPVKIMDANGSGYTSYLTSGITWAANHGATVINMSVGGFPNSPYVQDAIDYAWSKGAVLVGAAGNNHVEETFFPASFNHVISVSATQADDEFTHWSSYGPKVTVSAPGGSVMTTNCEKARTATCRYYGDHIVISGTSFAAPNVAGVVALIRARYPDKSNQWVVDRLRGTVDDLGYAGWDKRYGAGRVNAYRAVGGSVAAPALSTGDSLEANNTATSADRLTLGVALNPSIHPAGDVDYFLVDAPRAGRIDVRATAVVDTVRLPKSSLPIDVVVELYTTSGTRLARVDSLDPAATELASATVSGASRVIVRVSNYLPNGNRAAYSVRATYVDTAAPQVSGRSPAPSSTDVNRFVQPVVRFNEAVKNATMATFHLRDMATGALVPATVVLESGGLQARIIADHQLAANHVHRVELGSGLTDLAGNALAPSTWTFTTGLYGFSDIAGSKFTEDIAWLFEAGITTGCAADRYCPTAPVTREQMASFLARALGLPATANDYFTDDEASSHESNINRVAAAGITTGCSTGHFCPGGLVSREQMASFLARALGLPATANDYFTDDEASSHEANINRIAAAAVTTGCATGRYCPTLNVTREQMAAFLHRAFGD
jgi:subtilisin family serine protease